MAGAVYHTTADAIFETNQFKSYRWNDGSFNLGPTWVQREPDGKLLVGGNFTVYYPTPASFTNVNRLVRLNVDGTLDGIFNVGLGATNTVEGQSKSLVESVIHLPNGQYLVAGTFNRFNGQARTNIVRLNNDGSLDNTYAPYFDGAYC